ncbi:L-aspartate oxidase [Microbacterium trichothecenolyticum]|uniref:L-aspartate oxidase n=1 Tax=Microbacterium trichothecenolyticum TaxID=69370 RepID=A0ABU0TPZ6_MICTR|nr:L-aspartate oxidase [Microbacterium trichothecenolyticum]MDQ1121741.1 L-aspartate oxidase [Microbacterium trichothecenolyticum]
MTTVVVVGSGIAGLTAALHAHESGCLVTVVTKGALADTNTRWAQGGIAAVTAPDDHVASHAADTLTAGAGLNDPAAVDVLVAEGPARIRELVERGVAFDRAADGDFSRGLEAAHAVPRILHAGGDATGAVIQAALGDAVRAAGITVREHALLRYLIVTDGRAGGVELADGERLAADAVILATGGAGQLYAHATNPAGATGDGIAAAIRAGAAVADLEFVQFHPTALAVGAPFLVSEAVRGEGATLIDDTGRRFAFDAHPDGELAPRDVVARANARAMAAQGGRPVRLDATALGAERLAQRFPTIDAAVRERGLDWAREPIPVTPAAHYLMGGVVTDLDGRTNVPGLYAVGETARTGVHGANRLASNSLLEGAVFGARAGTAVARDTSWPVVPLATAVMAATAADDAPPFSRAALQQLMWNAAGLVRDADGLARAAGVLAAWATVSTPMSVEDDNLLLVASHVVAAAQTRTGSVGAHFRADAADAAAPDDMAGPTHAGRACADAASTDTRPDVDGSPAVPASTPAPREVLAC